jgi:hypothetical protein
MDQCKSRLSAPRQKLLRTMQQLHFGKIEDLVVLSGEPSSTPPPKITKEIKLGIDAIDRSAAEQNDFALKRQVTDLFAQFDQLSDGSVVTIEIRHGLPARLIVARRS